MSGVFKAIGKVFKKVFNFVKKAAPIILGVAAIVLTAGAASPALAGALSQITGLSTTTLSGGVSGLVSSAVGATGLSGTAATVLTGAVTKAAYGSAIGLVTGGAKGAAQGAEIGAALGATTGLLNAATGGAAAGVGAGEVANAGGVPGVQLDASGALQRVPAAAATAQPTGLLSGVGNFVNNNPIVAGKIIEGVGSGIGNYATAKSAEQEAQRQRDYISGNYAVVPPPNANVAAPSATPNLRPTFQAPTGAPGTPVAQQQTGGRYWWDPQQGKIVWLPATPVAAA